MANISSTSNSAHFNNSVKTNPTCSHLERKMVVRHDFYQDYFSRNRSSPPEVFLGKGVLKVCNNFTGEHQCRNAIPLEIAFRHGCSTVNLLHIFRKNLFLRTPLEGCFWIKDWFWVLLEVFLILFSRREIFVFYLGFITS